MQKTLGLFLLLSFVEAADADTMEPVAQRYGLTEEQFDWVALPVILALSATLYYGPSTLWEWWG